MRHDRSYSVAERQRLADNDQANHARDRRAALRAPVGIGRVLFFSRLDSPRSAKRKERKGKEEYLYSAFSHQGT